jgi:DNA-binding FadR family transcriptional regulator
MGELVMTRLHNVDRPPEADQGDPIVQKLAQLIQGVGPDRRLPSERDMSLSIGVSRVALRDRLQGFEILGILERRQGSGTFVRQLDPNGLASLLDLMLYTSFVSHSNVRVRNRRPLHQQRILGKCIGVSTFSNMEHE